MIENAFREYALYGDSPYRINDKIMKKVPKVKIIDAEFVGNGVWNGRFSKNVQPEDIGAHVRLYPMMWDVMPYLSKTAIAVFFYAVKELKKGEATVVLNVASIAHYLKYKSHSNVYLGICDLLKWKILARKVGRDQYWINHMFFFKGSRAKYIESIEDVYVEGVITEEEVLGNIKNLMEK